MNFLRQSDLTHEFHNMLKDYDQTIKTIVGPNYPYPIRMRDWELCQILTALQSINKSAKILDIGSFNTYLGIFLHQQFPDVTVSDMLTHRCIKSLLRKTNLAPKKPTEAFYFDWSKIVKQSGIKLRNINATAINLPDRSFDCIIALSVIERIPAVEQAIAEMYRILSPGGKLLITTDCSPEPQPYDASAGVRYFSLNELRTLFAPYTTTSEFNDPDFSEENWCYGKNKPIVTGFIEITKQ
ncbi:MAG: methyltransferase domain-containing protein [Gammaproteobacteria bacterium]|nr:methyltransferase domain-containing protein [Gammaproteobacteria bacterium]